VGVVAEDFEAVFAAGELPGEIGDDRVELGREGGKIGGGEGEEGAAGISRGVEEGIVTLLVRLAARGVDGGLGGPEAGEGLAPPVIPAKAGTQGHLGASWRTDGVPGSRIKSGMTSKGRGADSA
jgi:hypothetical protein